MATALGRQRAERQYQPSRTAVPLTATISIDSDAPSAE
jgi:hypothetical protein